MTSKANGLFVVLDQVIPNAGCGTAAREILDRAAIK
jgi:hypothetical protein